MTLPNDYDKDEFSRIKKAAERIRQSSDALIVIGIGGSYLGARAAIEALSHTFHNQMNGNTQIYFAGQNISSTYISHLFEMLRRQRYFDQCDFKIRYYNRTCDRFPDFP